MIPKIQSLSLPGREILADLQGREMGPSVIIDGSVVSDSGSTPTTLLRPGNVLVKKTANGKFYLADDYTNGDANTQASASSGAAIGAGAASKTFIWSYKGGTPQTVTTGAGSNTAALVATDLNNNANFAADLIASNSGSTLIITAKRAGENEWFQILNGTINNQDGGNLTFTTNATFIGAFSDYEVLAQYIQLTDINGAAADAVASTIRKGRFKKSQLLHLTAGAEAALVARGSTFV